MSTWIKKKIKLIDRKRSNILHSSSIIFSSTYFKAFYVYPYYMFTFSWLDIKTLVALILQLKSWKIPTSISFSACWWKSTLVVAYPGCFTKCFFSAERYEIKNYIYVRGIPFHLDRAKGLLDYSICTWIEISTSSIFNRLCSLVARLAIASKYWNEKNRSYSRQRFQV